MTVDEVIKEFLKGNIAKTSHMHSEVVLGAPKIHNDLVLYSYGEPIAVINAEGQVTVATKESLHYTSVTTSKHINAVAGRASMHGDVERTDDIREFIKT